MLSKADIFTVIKSYYFGSCLKLVCDLVQVTIPDPPALFWFSVSEKTLKLIEQSESNTRV